jgi:hypothetical protein
MKTEAIYFPPAKRKKTGSILLSDVFISLKNGGLIHVTGLNNELKPLRKLGYRVSSGFKIPSIRIQPLRGQDGRTIMRDVRSVYGWRVETAEQRLKRLGKLKKPSRIKRSTLVAI